MMYRIIHCPLIQTSNPSMNTGRIFALKQINNTVTNYVILFTKFPKLKLTRSKTDKRTAQLEISEADDDTATAGSL